MEVWGIMLKLAIAGILSALLVVSCSSSRGMKGSDASATLSPRKEIKVDPETSPENFVVKVRNVADFSYSNKNRFELFVNGKKVRPVNKIHNGTRNYIYRLTLQPGYYEVKGKYFWQGGWKEEKTNVKTKDMVRISPGERTMLELNIEKDRGILVDKDLRFSVRHESLSGNTQQVAKKEAPKAKTTQQRSAVQEPAVISEPVATTAQRSSSGKVKLQINTEPDNCDVILDDAMVGQSPLSIWVDPNTSYVVQLKHPNYRTLIRYIDEEKLKEKNKIILIERLEAVERSGL